MSNIRFDPATRFKWLDFSGEPLTAEEDIQLKRYMAFMYTSVINIQLKFVGLAPCSSEIRMLTTLKIDGEESKSNLFGAYTITQVDSLIQQNTNQLVKDNLTAITTSLESKLNLPIDISDVKKKFRECARESLFVVSLIAIPIDFNQSGVKERYILHQNILVIAKNKGIVFWIEPQTTIDPRYEAAMIKSIKNLVTDIGMADPTVINPVEVCPQAVTKDNNCMFWAYVIFMLIMENPTEYDHNKLIKQFMEKYPTKESLEKYMNGFKRALISALSTGGKRFRKHRTRRTHKKRKTIRRK
jgi:hypothetical protein